MLASGVTAIMGFAALIASDIRMLRDFGVVTVVDLTVSLLGVMVVLPAALVWAERRQLRPARPRPARLVARAARGALRSAAAARARRFRARGFHGRAARVPDDRTDDRFGDLGPREPTAAERFAELDEGDMEAERGSASGRRPARRARAGATPGSSAWPP